VGSIRLVVSLCNLPKNLALIGFPPGSRKSGAAKRKIEPDSGSTPDAEPLGYEQELLEKDKELQQFTEHKTRRQQVRSQIIVHQPT